MAETGDNSVTLQSYDDHINEYVEATPNQISGHVKLWLDEALSFTNHTAPILELGSGTGRDADYIEKCGYKIVRSDAAKGFISRLRNQGHSAKHLNALTDDLDGPYAAILANAVFLHFTPGQLTNVLKKARTALVDDGVLAFTVKQGTGSEWRDTKLGTPRFFQYWQSDALKHQVENNGFEIISFKSFPSSSRPGTVWLHLIARKAPEKPNFAVIFDMDGVLIDSQPAVAVALSTELKKYNLKIEDLKTYHPAHSSKTVIDIVQKEHGITIEPTAFIQALVENITGQLQNAKIDPALETLIHDLKRQKVPLAVGSSATHASIMRKLAILGLSETFDVIIGAEDVTAHKPAPDVYLEAARRLGYNANHCIVVEDNIVGATAAHSAGAYAIGFGKYNADPHAPFGADLHVSDWSDLSAKLLEKLINQRIGDNK